MNGGRDRANGPALEPYPHSRLAARESAVLEPGDRKDHARFHNVQQARPVCCTPWLFLLASQVVVMPYLICVLMMGSRDSTLRRYVNGWLSRQIARGRVKPSWPSRLH